MPLSAEDKEFICRALAMHAVFTQSFGLSGGRPPDAQAESIANWISGFASGEPLTSTLPAGAKLISADISDAKALTYSLPSQPVLAVFDGHVVLEPTCYEIGSGNLQLHRPPADAIKFLVAAHG